MRRRLLTIGKLLFFFLPLLLGTIGFVALDGRPLIDSLFACVTMYAMNYSDKPANIFV